MQRWFCLLLFGTAATSIISAANGYKEAKSRSAVGPCILSRCPDGFVCDDNLCLPDMSKMEKIGVCVNTLCPDGYFCHNDSCIRPIPKKVSGSTPIGPCINQQCPTKHMCDPSDYQCYPTA